jgi:hypothetical protein
MHRSALFLLALLPACATVSSGGFDIPASFAETAFPRLKNRATFDLDCPPEQLTIVTLNVISSPAGNYPSEVGVRGCGRKAVYVPREETWRLSGGLSSTHDEPAKAAPPAADKPPAP